MKKKLVKGNILAEGEATGHNHRVTVKVMEREDGLREFTGPTTIIHEEHKEFPIPFGEWLSGQKREADHLQDMVRTVID